MPSRKQQPLTREGEPRQTTENGLETPVPTEQEVSDFFDKVLVKRGGTKPEPSNPTDHSAEHSPSLRIPVVVAEGALL